MRRSLPNSICRGPKASRPVEGAEMQWDSQTAGFSIWRKNGRSHFSFMARRASGSGGIRFGAFGWCPEVWAAQGYVVVVPIQRFDRIGQKFVDEISGDWAACLTRRLDGRGRLCLKSCLTSK